VWIGGPQKSLESLAGHQAAERWLDRALEKRRAQKDEEKRRGQVWEKPRDQVVCRREERREQVSAAQLKSRTVKLPSPVFDLPSTPLCSERVRPSSRACLCRSLPGAPILGSA
jgi:hypothetical protein